MKAGTVKSAISRFRDKEYYISTETTETSGDPRYRLIARPKEPVPHVSERPR
jgi:hypothetical protein